MVSTILIHIIQDEQYFFSFQAHVSVVCLFLSKSHHIMLESHVSSSVSCLIRIIKVIMVHEKTKKIYTSVDYLGYFGALSPKWDFFQKIRLCQFIFKEPNFMRSFKNILWAIFMKMCFPNDILAYWQWWNHRTPFRIKVGTQKLYHLMLSMLTLPRIYII